MYKITCKIKKPDGKVYKYATTKDDKESAIDLMKRLKKNGYESINCKKISEINSTPIEVPVDSFIGEPTDEDCQEVVSSLFGNEDAWIEDYEYEK